MKTIEKYIKESLLDDEDDLVDGELYQPKNKDELIEAIKTCLDAKIYDLNCIDTSRITDMSHLFDSSMFYRIFNPLEDYRKYFNKINISKWNVSNVKNMSSMFYGANFNGDISKWNVSNVICMDYIFAESKFNGDISKWNVSNVINMSCMFCLANFNGDISKWDVSKVKHMNYMFYNSKFKGDVSKWNISKDTSTNNMF